MHFVSSSGVQACLPPGVVHLAECSNRSQVTSCGPVPCAADTVRKWEALLQLHSRCRSVGNKADASMRCRRYTANCLADQAALA